MALCMPLKSIDPFILLEEVYEALYNDARRLAAMGVRSLLEQIMVEKVGEQQSFKKLIDTFAEQGFISPLQKERVEGIVEAGHASVHRNFTPSVADLKTLLDITESLIADIYVHLRSVEQLTKEFPVEARKNLASMSCRPCCAAPVHLDAILVDPLAKGRIWESKAKLTGRLSWSNSSTNPRSAAGSLPALTSGAMASCQLRGVRSDDPLRIRRGAGGTQARPRQLYHPATLEAAVADGVLAAGGTPLSGRATGPISSKLNMVQTGGR
jgi:hypothetical protein